MTPADLLDRLAIMNVIAAAAILILLAVGPLLRRGFGARLAYAAWAIVPLSALAALLPPMPAAYAGFEPPPSLVTPGHAPPMAVIEVPTPDAVDWAPALLAGWALVAAMLLIATFWAQARAVRMLGRLIPETGHPDGAAVVRASNPSAGPAVVGVLRPRIVLPSDFEARFDARERAVILAHERAHLSSGDTAANTLIAILRCLCWFNPLIHLAARRARLDQELACDETVIAQHPGARRVYGEALLKSQMAAAPLPFGCYWPSRSARRLKQRILMLTRPRPDRMRRRLGAALVVLLGTGLGYAAWAAAPAPPVQPAQAKAALVAPPRPPAPRSAEGFVPVRSEAGDRAAEQARADSRAAPAGRAVATRATQTRPVLAAAEGLPLPPLPPPGPRAPSSVQLLTRGDDLVLFTCEPTADPSRVTCSAVPTNAHEPIAARAYARATELYRIALSRTPAPAVAAPIRVSCYWPSKAAVRKPWTRTPDWRCQSATHLSVTAALAKVAPPQARLLSYTCQPAENNGLRSCSASAVFDVRADNPTVYPLTIGGTPLVQAMAPQGYELVRN